jgi:hypothetical protein
VPRRAYLLAVTIGRCSKSWARRWSGESGVCHRPRARSAMATASEDAIPIRLHTGDDQRTLSWGSASGSPGSRSDRNIPNRRCCVRFSCRMVPEVYQVFWAGMAAGSSSTMPRSRPAAIANKAPAGWVYRLINGSPVKATSATTLRTTIHGTYPPPLVRAMPATRNRPTVAGFPVHSSASNSQVSGQA